jgi:ribose transport system ATP-binding protein
MAPSEIVRLMVGRDVTDLFPRTSRSAGDVLLRVDGLVPGDATFALHRGEILGIAGLVGAGRTELVRAVFGLDPVRAGRITVGAFTGAASPRRRWRQGVGMVSEDRKDEGVALGMTIADNLTLTRLASFGPGPFILPSRQQAAARRWVERLRIRCSSLTQAAAALSGGNQQKLALGRLLQHDVDVLLLDEPTRGIDVGSKAELYAVIDQLVSAPAGANRKPRGVLLVSSYLPELLGLCDRIAVMHRGRLGPVRPVTDWNEHTLMLAATGAEAA